MTDIKDLVDTQKGYDLLYWKEKDKWKDLVHLNLHLCKMIGKIGSITEPYQHGNFESTKELEQNIIPDLLIYALHLSIKWNVDLEKSYRNRLSRNIIKRERLE